MLLRRAVFLFVLGLINMTVFDADILHFYAVYFVVGAAFLTAPTRALWLGSVGVVALAVLAVMIFNYDLGWDWETLTYTDLWTLPGFLRNLFFNGWHPVLPWAAFPVDRNGYWAIRTAHDLHSTQADHVGVRSCRICPVSANVGLGP